MIDIQAKEDASIEIQQVTDLQREKKVLEVSVHEKQDLLIAKVKSIGNYVHDSVPVSDNEDDNVIVRSWQPSPDVALERQDCLSHHEVLTRIDGWDSARAVKIAGHRGYCLIGYGLFLNLALINYGLEFLHNKGYKPNQPPHFMLQSHMAKTAQLDQFDEELYKVVERERPSPHEDDSSGDKYLIATSEQPLSALHSGEWLQAGDLPIR